MNWGRLRLVRRGTRGGDGVEAGYLVVRSPGVGSPPGFHVYTVPAAVAGPTMVEMNAGVSLEFRGVLAPGEDGGPVVVHACGADGCALPLGHAREHSPVPLIPLRGFEP